MPDEPIDPLFDESFDALSDAPLDGLSEAPLDAMSESPLDAMSDAPIDELSEASSEVSLEVPPEESTEDAVPPPAKREPGRLAMAFNVYNAMLMIAALALTVATVLMFLEWARYGFTSGPPNR